MFFNSNISLLKKKIDEINDLVNIIESDLNRNNNQFIEPFDEQETNRVFVSSNDDFDFQEIFDELGKDFIISETPKKALITEQLDDSILHNCDSNRYTQK